MSGKKEKFTVRAAVYLVLVKDGKVLLSRRYKTGWMDGMYSLIAGHLDGNEPIGKAMIREAHEEAGIEIDKKDLIPNKVLHRKTEACEYMDFFFTVKTWGGEPKIMELNKCDNMRWFPIYNLPKNTLPYIRNVIENLNDKVAFIESGWK